MKDLTEDHKQLLATILIISYECNKYMSYHDNFKVEYLAGGINTIKCNTIANTSLNYEYIDIDKLEELKNFTDIYTSDIHTIIDTLQNTMYTYGNQTENLTRIRQEFIYWLNSNNLTYHKLRTEIIRVWISKATGRLGTIRGWPTKPTKFVHFIKDKYRMSSHYSKSINPANYGTIVIADKYNGIHVDVTHTNSSN